MSAQTQTQAKPTPMPMPFLTRAPTGLVQRKCACGGSPGVDDECDECRKQRLRVQRRSTDTSEFHIVSQALHAMAQPFDSAADRALGHDFGRVAVELHAPERIQTQRLVSQPGDPYEQEADRAATQVTHEAASTSRPALTTSSTPLVIRRRALEDEEETFGEDIANPKAEATETAEPAATEATPEAASPATEPMPEAAPAPEPEEAAPEPVGESLGRGLIVEDDAALGSGQMPKSAFLDEMRASACAVADAELAAVGRSTEGCPYIERWIGYYRTRDSAHIERAIRKYAPETAGVASAREYIPLVSERIRQGVARWARTGELTGVPEELVSQVMGGGVLGAIGGAVSSVAGAVSSVVSGIGGLFFKGREGGARDAERADPQAIRAQLGGGSPLDSGVRARMESAFGHDFSRVRVYTDGQAVNLSSSLNARAFTLGSDIAFGAGEYQPGTLIGDALLAHELAHVVQQGGTITSDAPMQKGETAYNALEEDADVSAVGAVVSLWSGAKRGLANIAENAMPRLRSGLRLQRCPKGSKSKCKVKSGPTYTPNGTINATPSGGMKTAAFDQYAEFEHDPANGFDASCCQIRQFTRWTVGPPPNHAGFKPESDFSINTWYEDRDDAGKRYGHRTGAYSECVSINHFETKTGTIDCAHGEVYKGHDDPIGASTRTGQWQFQLKVVDACDGDKEVGTPASVNVAW